MTDTLEELFGQGHRKVVCTHDGEYNWWTVGKTYEFNNDGFLVDDDGDECNETNATFKPYSFFGMQNKEFTSDEMEHLAQAVAEKVIAILKEKL